MKKIILIYFLLITGSAFAQSNNDQARAYFSKAKSSFASSSYEDAIGHLIKAEKLLGNTNPVILNLKVKAYCNLKQYNNAKTALNQFSKVSSNAEADLVDETLSYIIKIDEGITTEIAAVKEKEEKEEKEKKRQNVMRNALNHFSYKTCKSCADYHPGEEKYFVKVSCDVGYNPGGWCENGYKKKYTRSGNNYSFKWEICTRCNGTKIQTISKYRKCSDCGGSNKTLQYDGDEYLSKSDIEYVLQNNLQEIKTNTVNRIKTRNIKAISQFEFKPCSKCNTHGIEEFVGDKKCEAGYTGPNRGYDKKWIYSRCYNGTCRSEYIKGRRTAKEVKWYKCTTCKGSGKVNYKYSKSCSACLGNSYILTYSGNDQFSKEEISNLTKTKLSEIILNISEKEIEKLVSKFNFGKYNDEITKYKNSTKTGCLSGDCANGFGTTRLATGELYSGYVSNNGRNGIGVNVYKNGEIYEGVWVDNKPNGFGKYTSPEEDVAKGFWIDGEMVELLESGKSSN